MFTPQHLIYLCSTYLQGANLCKSIFSSREGRHDRRIGVLIVEKNSCKCHVNMICKKPSAGIEPRGVSGI